MASFADLSSSEGLKSLDQHLLTRSYISGYQASRDDLAVYSALNSAPSGSYANAQRWYNHITALLGASFPGQSSGVTIAGQKASAAGTTSISTQATSALDSVRAGVSSLAAKVLPASSQPKPAAAAAPAAAADDDDDSDDDDEDIDLFGDLTPEEQEAADRKKAIVEEAKKRGAEKAKKSKSMVVLEVKPWDDETDLKAMENEVRAIQKDGLLWGKSQLVPIGFGIKKLQITAVIEDSKVESMDAIIEEELVRDGESETIQSIDIASFNKL
jgi:elongation factor 1-beta